MQLDTWDLTRLAGFSSAQKVKKDLCKARWFNTVLVCLETGQEIPSRPEPYDVCFYVIDGHGTITVGTEEVKVTRGRMVFAPANMARGIKSENRLTILGIQQPH